MVPTPSRDRGSRRVPKKGDFVVDLGANLMVASRRVAQVVRWDRSQSTPQFAEFPNPARFLIECGDPAIGRSTVAWNSERGQLSASADLLWHHPLYYSLAGDIVSIATRAHALANRSLGSLFLPSLAAHLCGSSAPLDRTFFSEVHALPPGTELRVERQRVDLPSAAAVQPWRTSAATARPRDAATAARVLYATLHEAVSDSTAEADPIGVTLSSGIDSTSLAAMLREARPRASRVAFIWSARSVPDADESGPALRVARSLGMEVVEIAADVHAPLSSKEGLEPDLDSPSVPIYREAWRETFRRAKEMGIQTVLTGHGGDLAFGGAFPFADLFLTGRWFRLMSEIAAYRRRVEVDVPWLIRYRVLGRAARWLWPRRTASAPRWLGSALQAQVPRRVEGKGRLVLPGTADRFGYLHGPRRFAATAQMTAEAQEFGVELRHPWLDPRLTDLAESLPASWTFRDGFSKAPVRVAMRGRLPSEILDRAEKIYPDAIFRRALRGPDRAKIEPLLDDMIAADLGFVEPRALREAVDAYAHGRGSGGFWHALTLEAWLRGFEKARPT